MKIDYEKPELLEAEFGIFASEGSNPVGPGDGDDGEW